MATELLQSGLNRLKPLCRKPIMAGFANLGNTCYINTTLQCLAHCPSFARFFFKYTDDEQNDLLGQVRDVIVKLWSTGNNKGTTGTAVITPHLFVRVLAKYFGASMAVFEENDIHEFIMILVDKMNEEASKKESLSLARSATAAATATSPASGIMMIDKLGERLDESWQAHFKKQLTPFVPMFYGQSITQIICGHCHKIFHNYEPFMVLTVSMESSLRECLHKYFQHETVNRHDDVAWKCDRCNQSKESKQSVKLWRVPTILIICLKRFSNNRAKLSKDVEVPKSLDLSDYMISGSKNDFTYDLYSVACHNGSTSGGHYHALCRLPNDEWRRYDDCHVNSVPFPAKTSSGYTFFYHKRI
jgi:ubiquitin carboxyl-terminal hydrolase 8